MDQGLPENNSDDQLSLYSAPLVRSNKWLHPKAKEVITQLCFWLKPEDIAAYLELHPRTVKRVWKTYTETGSVVAKRDPDTVGRPPTLDWTHGMVHIHSFSFLLMFSDTSTVLRASYRTPTGPQTCRNSGTAA